MKRIGRQLSFAVLLAIVLVPLAMTAALAGDTSEFGTLAGSPVQANYVAWRTLAGAPPSQVITEDAFNSSIGPNGGYESLFWQLAVPTLSNVQNGDQIQMVFGGLGTDAGSIWNYSFNWDQLTESQTNHGEVGPSTAGSCPVMTQGLLTGDVKTINWTGPAGNYLIYRAILPSGAPVGGQSNGEYEFVGSVQTITSVGTFNDTLPAGVTESWHIVIPADAGGNITGCHSEESNPNAVRLTSLRSVSSGSPLMAIGAGALGMAALGLGLRRWRKVS